MTLVLNRGNMESLTKIPIFSIGLRVQELLPLDATEQESRDLKNSRYYSQQKHNMLGRCFGYVKDISFPVRAEEVKEAPKASGVGSGLLKVEGEVYPAPSRRLVGGGAHRGCCQGPPGAARLFARGEWGLNLLLGGGVLEIPTSTIKSSTLHPSIKNSEKW